MSQVKSDVIDPESGEVGKGAKEKERRRRKAKEKEEGGDASLCPPTTCSFPCLAPRSHLPDISLVFQTLLVRHLHAFTTLLREH